MFSLSSRQSAPCCWMAFSDNKQILVISNEIKLNIASSCYPSERGICKTRSLRKLSHQVEGITRGIRVPFRRWHGQLDGKVVKVPPSLSQRSWPCPTSPPAGWLTLPSFGRLNKIGKQNPNLHGSVADHDEDDDGSPDMTAIVSALAQQQQRVSSPTCFQFTLRLI